MNVPDREEDADALPGRPAILFVFHDHNAAIGRGNNQARIARYRPFGISKERKDKESEANEHGAGYIGHGRTKYKGNQTENERRNAERVAFFDHGHPGSVARRIRGRVLVLLLQIPDAERSALACGSVDRRGSKSSARIM